MIFSAKVHFSVDSKKISDTGILISEHYRIDRAKQRTCIMVFITTPTPSFIFLGKLDVFLS